MVNASALCAESQKFVSQRPAEAYTVCTTASTSTQVAVLPWCYDVEMGTANSLHVSM